MGNDFILDECEIATAVNKIESLVDALSASIDNYISILSDVRSNAIKDADICTALDGIIGLARSYQGAISSLSGGLSSVINAAASDAEGNDTFQFPLDFMTEVTYLLSRFL